VYQPQLGRGWQTLYKKFLYSGLVDYVLHYYDGTCVREGPAPDPSRKYVFVVYPHGVYGACRAFSGGSCFASLFPGITARWGSFGAAFYLPGVREFSLMSGCLDASKGVLLKTIASGDNVMLLPGGIDEMALSDSESKETVLVDRWGYAKMAIETGCDIIPGFCFGEKWIHRRVLLPHRVRSWLYRVVRMSGTLLKGRGPSFLGYLGVPLGFVWGEPIKVTQQKVVSEAYLNDIHNQCKEQVQSIFERYKEQFGYSSEETLRFVSVKEARTFDKKL